MKKKISIILRIVVSFGLLGLLFWVMREDISNILGIIVKSNPLYVTAAVALILTNVLMLSFRLKVIFTGENLKVTLKEALQLTFIGYFFNNFMPTAVGGDIIKAHYAAKVNKKRVQSYASVLMDRFIGLYTFLIVAAVALLVDKGRFELVTLKYIVFALILAGIAAFFVVTNTTVARFMERIFARMKMFQLGEKLNAIYDIVHDYRNRHGVVLKALLISTFAQCLYFTVVYLFFFSMGSPVGLGNIYLVMPVVTFISMVPSVGGLGAREAAIVAFFAPLVGRETAFAVSLLLLFSLLLISIIGGGIYLWWGITGARKEKTE